MVRQHRRRAARRRRTYPGNSENRVRLDAGRRHLAVAVAYARRLARGDFVVLGCSSTPWMARPDVLDWAKRYAGRRAGCLGQALRRCRRKGSKYDLERWLEYDGDGRTARDAQGRRRVLMRCGRVHCASQGRDRRRCPPSGSRRRRLPQRRHARFSTAEAVRLRRFRARSIDVFDRWRNGAYALYLDRDEDSPEPRVRLETVAAHRGVRPWSPMPHRTVHREAGGRWDGQGRWAAEAAHSWGARNCGRKN